MRNPWKPVTNTEPPDLHTAYLYRAGDLFPAVGFRVYEPEDDETHWLHEDAGPEDGDHQTWERIGGEGWAPTHWREIEGLPVGET